MKSVVIIGAGITGLTAAFYLKRAGVPVTVYEAGERAGGVIRSRRQGGFLAESGPNTLLEASPEISGLVRDLDLGLRRIDTNPDAKKRFVVHDSKPVAVPTSVLEFLTTKLFSARAKFAVLREPFVPPRRDHGDESVAEFVLRRLNREFLERTIDPLIVGIHAGDAEKLSVRHAFPKLYELEQKYGSLIRGRFFGAGKKKIWQTFPAPFQNIFLRRRLAGFTRCAGGAAWRFVEIENASHKTRANKRRLAGDNFRRRN